MGLCSNRLQYHIAEVFCMAGVLGWLEIIGKEREVFG